jgi:succinate-acetate transporter protein
MNAHPYPGSEPEPEPEHAAGTTGAGVRDEAEAEYREWTGRSRLVFTPIAAPSILGLFGFAGATFMVASNLAEWWGNTLLSPLVLAPFVIFFGGLAQLTAAMWAYRARDAVATAMHGTWGTFWIAWGMLMIMAANGLLPSTQEVPRAFGFWWIVLAVVTIFGALAALGDNLGIFLVLALLAAGSALLATGLIGGFHNLVIAAGWVLVASAAAAFYTAGALMLQQAFGGRVILPLGRWSLRGNLPGHRDIRPITYPSGMPGAKAGQ